MGINVELANAQAGTCRNYAAELRELRNSLLQFKSGLDQAWQAEEMQYVNDAIDQILHEIYGVSNQIDELGGDVISVANEIRREEEALEAAAREAAARRAAMEAAARETIMRQLFHF